MSKTDKANCEEPLVSVVMNCRNGQAYLHESLGSIIDQTYSNIEVIFFDNNSTDNSLEIASKFGDKVKIYSSLEDLTLGQARNEALELANGEYIAFLDVDDKFHPQKIEKQIFSLKKNNKLWGFGSYGTIDHHGEVLKNKINISIPKNTESFVSLLTNYRVNFQTLIFHKKILEELSPLFPAELKVIPDFCLAMKLASFYEPDVCSDLLSYYRSHPGQLRHKTLDLIESEYLFTIEQLEEINKNNKKRTQLLRRWKEKSHYFQAINSINKNKINEAKLGFKKARNVSSSFYLVWLFSILVPFGPRIIYKILRG